MSQAASSSRSEDNFRMTDLFSPNDAFAHPRSQAAAAEPATRPSVAGAPDSFVFVNPLFSSPRDPRPHTQR
ncbi:MAG TPA: hypothetical protein VK477_00540 [Acidobacteriota bacterium]|nr:hypothetical protein [Acidobacteriota bacterium]